MKKIAKQKNIIFLEELNNLFNKIISYEILPEIYLRLSARIYHYLIDEFQDTNILQWKNLYPLIYESISSQGTLFIVGDKKQSIYRFRGGEPKLFDKIETDYFAHYGCYRDYLTQNYRSKKSIVEFNNIIFSQENLERFCKSLENVENIQDIISEIENVYSNTKQEYVKNESEKETVGYVYGELVDIPKDQEYEDMIKPKLINLINKLISQKYNYSDISILLRTNSEVRTITEWLIQENIPVESEQTL
ncbi:MAG: UvrD-helicase domain-containing protein, partial [Endomicrobia bacterium]|nr:UvrD-helicase domain-containing protein [Endomicrobiia bacterium]